MNIQNIEITDTLPLISVEEVEQIEITDTLPLIDVETIETIEAADSLPLIDVQTIKTIEITDTLPLIDVQTWKPSKSQKSELRIKKLNYTFSVYKTMLLDYIKRAQYLNYNSRTIQEYIEKMNRALNLIDLENSIYH